MKKIVLVATIAAAALNLAACAKSTGDNAALTNEVTLNEEVPVEDNLAATDNLSAVDGASLGNNSADAVLPADNAAASGVGANAATANGL